MSNDQKRSSARQDEGKPAQVTGPIVGQSTRNDTSPPLRDLPPEPPRKGDGIREMPRPRPTKPGPTSERTKG